MIAASATQDVPWGYVCGYPTNRGDLYGGGHYLQSSAAHLTPQGRAIAAASRRFGNGETLPFTPCKRGYIPLVTAAASDDSSTQPRAMFACHLHDRFRRKRYLREKSTFRPGEVDLSHFWEREGCETTEISSSQKEIKTKTEELASTCSEGALDGRLEVVRSNPKIDRTSDEPE